MNKLICTKHSTGGLGNKYKKTQNQEIPMWNLNIIKKKNDSRTLEALCSNHLEMISSSLYAFGFFWDLHSFASEKILDDSPLQLNSIKPHYCFSGINHAPKESVAGDPCSQAALC